MSVNLGTCGAIRFDINFEISSREPFPYTRKEVTSINGGGYPLITEYYYGNEFVFYTTQTYNAQNIEMTWEVFQP
jgi:hypothetical protein